MSKLDIYDGDITYSWVNGTVHHPQYYGREDQGRPYDKIEVSYGGSKAPRLNVRVELPEWKNKFIAGRTTDEVLQSLSRSMTTVNGVEVINSSVGEDVSEGDYICLSTEVAEYYLYMNTRRFTTLHHLHQHSIIKALVDEGFDSTFDTVPSGCETRVIRQISIHEATGAI
tara:strand:+ start:1482 stop:1991 length:510 start_codon:yes stop_codon:yes gene_type:complete